MRAKSASAIRDTLRNNVAKLLGARFVSNALERVPIGTVVDIWRVVGAESERLDHLNGHA